MADLIVGLYEDWLWLDERIESITDEIEEIAQTTESCNRLMSVPGVGPIISTAKWRQSATVRRSNADATSARGSV